MLVVLVMFLLPLFYRESLAPAGAAWHYPRTTDLK
jgi:hypothetical protein